MFTVASDAPETCPGVESQDAGKASGCQGCPNQQICASGKSQIPDPDIEVITKHLSTVKHIILVMSGKGGVGKSTTAVTLASLLAEDETKNVGILDIDICGPSVPTIAGVEGEQVHQSGSGWSPVFVEENLSVMSVGFLLESPDEAVIWRGPKKNGLIKQFLRDVDWGELDYLVIDTPPGTSDEHLSIVQYLKKSNVAGVVLVTTPQEISLLDVRKQITFCRKVNLPILGIIENMSVFTCPKCKTEVKIFPPTTGGGQKMAEEMNVSFLGKVELDPLIGKSCDKGTLFTRVFPDSPVTKCYKDIAKKIQIKVDKKIDTS